MINSSINIITIKIMNKATETLIACLGAYGTAYYFLDKPTISERLSSPRLAGGVTLLMGIVDNLVKQILKDRQYFCDRPLARKGISYCASIAFGAAFMLTTRQLKLFQASPLTIFSLAVTSSFLVKMVKKTLKFLKMKLEPTLEELDLSKQTLTDAFTKKIISKHSQLKKLILPPPQNCKVTDFKFLSKWNNLKTLAISQTMWQDNDILMSITAYLPQSALIDIYED
jgi:hypothetical protein